MRKKLKIRKICNFNIRKKLKAELMESGTDSATVYCYLFSVYLFVSKTYLVIFIFVVQFDSY